MSEKKESPCWARFKKACEKAGCTPKKVPRKDELGETWNVFQTFKDGRLVGEVREDRV